MIGRVEGDAVAGPRPEVAAQAFREASYPRADLRESRDDLLAESERGPFAEGERASLEPLRYVHRVRELNAAAAPGP